MADMPRRIDLGEKELEDDDPYELIGIRVPLEKGVDPDSVMARCFIEEYALMGVPHAKLMQLVRSPAFAGTHAIWVRQGDRFIESLIAEVYGLEREEMS